MKKFADVATVKGSEKWINSIKRETTLYSPKYEVPVTRTEFDRDYTRILNCNAYKRLKHKTQVFFSPQNDHICTRIEHVNLVDSISYSIANILGLNTELTKSIAISHDIGHTPFGHQGERILSTISERECNQKFWHARNGLYFVDNLELLEDYECKKRNLDLCYAVRDGIIGHSGKIDPNGLKPRNEYINLEKEFLSSGQFNPYTWEGCVVKIADNISYIGRDIEDAKTMGLLNESDIKAINKLTEKITVNNSNIINYLVADLCENSTVENGLKFSEEAKKTMETIQKFNSEKIYKNEKIEPTVRYFTVLINEIFYTLKKEYNGKKTINNLKKMGKYYPELSREFIGWLSNYSKIKERNEDCYKNKIIYDLDKIEDYNKAILAYLSGMTDNYIVKIYNEIVAF